MTGSSCIHLTLLVIIPLLVGAMVGDAFGTGWQMVVTVGLPLCWITLLAVIGAIRRFWSNLTEMKSRQ
jgi:hypothetical protein